MERVRIERLGHRGDGIAGSLRVPRALPGEEIEGEATDGRIDRPRILDPSPRRVKPACPHYAACGGCALLHADDAFVAEWKVEVVRTALAARGLPAPIAGIATSPERSRRRATLAARRTKQGALAGFHARASDTLTPIPDCRVVVPEITAALPHIEALARLGASRKAELSVAVTAGPAGLDLTVTNGKPVDAALGEGLTEIALRADLARLVWKGEPVYAARPPVQSFGDATIVPPPGAFLQATKAGEVALTAAVEAALSGASRIVDLFAGCGTFALPLSRHAEIHAVEGDAALLVALEKSWRNAAGRHALRTERRDLFRRPLLAAELDRFDAAVVDPPRAGAEAQMREIAGSRLKRIASVSCNPVTFARDTEILVRAGFRLNEIRVVDQFRWSPHVEIVASLTR
ncbi:23S rRNA (uracil1939-C5)-methyltransferase [Palleronia aestuarii]|uniref:23S rRNA (Uracil1939-C5)-methyltransferase n=1 Tax=Palleronia aestuarii TaxID=568105 RepID=A0A2W7P0F7_9RHOB|nr:class I SAM-dependent RNA methyltransferase [Palleronia aestuarii]PZX18946.1 23S rRNA (uracil1939-C5)-methyltransferase [Palleronia aestuarii]